MRRTAAPALGACALLGVVMLQASCNKPGTQLVSIFPISGWADGCTEVTVAGSGFSDDASVTIGGIPLENARLPDPVEEADEVGYAVYGRIPEGAPGYATVALTTGGETYELKDTWYYLTCPSLGTIDSVSQEEGLATGDTITLQGCQLTTDITVRIGDSTTDVALESVCGTATASFEAPPDVSDGTWYVSFRDSSGTQFYPDAACDTSVPPDPPTDTATVDPCAGALALTFGGG